MAAGVLRSMSIHRAVEAALVARMLPLGTEQAKACFLFVFL
jgi:hypothetical protein